MIFIFSFFFGQVGFKLVVSGIASLPFFEVSLCMKLLNARRVSVCLVTCPVTYSNFLKT